MTTELGRKTLRNHKASNSHPEVGELVRIEENGKPVNGIYFHTRIPLTPKEAVIFLRAERIINKHEKVVAITSLGIVSDGKYGYAARTDGMAGPINYLPPKRLHEFVIFLQKRILRAHQIMGQKSVSGK